MRRVRGRTRRPFPCRASRHLAGAEAEGDTEPQPLRSLQPVWAAAAHERRLLHPAIAFARVPPGKPTAEGIRAARIRLASCAGALVPGSAHQPRSIGPVATLACIANAGEGGFAQRSERVRTAVGAVIAVLGSCRPPARSSWARFGCGYRCAADRGATSASGTPDQRVGPSLGVSGEAGAGQRRAQGCEHMGDNSCSE